MATEHHDAIDGFLADADELLAGGSGAEGLAHRLRADDVPAGTVRWRIERADPEQFTEERITERSDGFWFEGVPVAFEDDADVEPPDEVLCVGPWDSLDRAIGWHPEVLTVLSGDHVHECDLPDRILVEFLLGDEWEIYLPSGAWRTGSDVALPADTEPIATWSNGDDYDFPGGDRTYCLYRFDDLYVAYDDGRLDLFGGFETQDEAVTEWIHHYLTDDIEPLEEIVARLGAGPGDGCSDEEVAAAVDEAVGDLPLEPVCELGGESHYSRAAVEAWWDREGCFAADEILERLASERTAGA